MAFVKRAFLFILTNIAIIVLATLIIFILERYLGFKITPNISNGYVGLAIFSLIFGFAGSIFSLLISRWMAKRMYGIELIQESQLLNYGSKEQQVYTTVAQIARQNGIDIPEVGIYDSADANAFATGPSKNRALVAVSTGLLESMTSSEIDGVIGHEMSHILNGDMVTMTLLQGVLNTFVIFIARVIGYFVDRVVFKNEKEGTGVGYLLTVMLMEILLGILASLILMAFSRYREYRADAGSAQMLGKDKMIQALKRLSFISEKREAIADQDDGKFAAFKISSRGGFLTLLSSHPPLEARIEKLQNMMV